MVKRKNLDKEGLFGYLQYGIGVDLPMPWLEALQHP